MNLFGIDSTILSKVKVNKTHNWVYDERLKTLSCMNCGLIGYLDWRCPECNTNSKHSSSNCNHNGESFFSYQYREIDQNKDNGCDFYRMQEALE